MNESLKGHLFRIIISQSCGLQCLKSLYFLNIQEAHSVFDKGVF